MSDKQYGGLGDFGLAFIDQWGTFKKEHPTLTLAAEIAPGTSIVTSGMDVARDLKEGDYSKIPLDALGMVPGLAVLKKIRDAEALARAKARAVEKGREAVQGFVNGNTSRKHLRRTANEVGAARAAETANSTKLKAALAAEVATVSDDTAEYLNSLGD